MKKTKNAFRTMILGICLILAATAEAQQGSGSSSVTNADRDETLLDLEIEDGEIESSAWNGRLQAGGVMPEDGRGGAGRLSLEAGHPVYILGDEKRDWEGDKSVGGVFRLDIGGDVALDVGPSPEGDAEIRRLELRLPTLTVLAGAQKGDIAPSGRPSHTFGFSLAEGDYRRLKDAETGTDISAADLRFGNVDGHVAFKVNGIQMDLCGFAKVLGVSIGRFELAGDRRDGAMVSHSGGVCAGVKLGEIAELRGGLEWAVRIVPRATKEDDGFDEAQDWIHSEVKVNVGLEKILDTPLYVEYEHAYEHAQSGPGNETDITRNMINAGLAF